MGKSPFPNSLRDQLTGEKDSRSKLINSRLIFQWRRMIINYCSKWYYWSLEWFSTSCSVWLSYSRPGRFGSEWIPSDVSEKTKNSLLWPERITRSLTGLWAGRGGTYKGDILTADRKIWKIGCMRYSSSKKSRRRRFLRETSWWVNIPTQQMVQQNCQRERDYEFRAPQSGNNL